MYQALEVPELWIYRRGLLRLYVLTPGGYQDSLTSPTFPDIDVKEIFPQYIERAWQAGSSVALKDFENFLQAL